MTNKTVLAHNGYTGTIEFDLDGGLLHGRVCGINDVVHYEAKTLEELKRAFQESVDDYLAFCEARGEKPQKPYSGVTNVRLGEELHREASMTATSIGLSLNDFLVGATRQYLRTVSDPPTSVETNTRHTKKAEAPKHHATPVGNRIRRVTRLKQTSQQKKKR